MTRSYVQSLEFWFWYIHTILGIHCLSLIPMFTAHEPHCVTVLLDIWGFSWCTPDRPMFQSYTSTHNLLSLLRLDRNKIGRWHASESKLDLKHFWICGKACTKFCNVRSLSSRVLMGNSFLKMHSYMYLDT